MVVCVCQMVFMIEFVDLKIFLSNTYLLYVMPIILVLCEFWLLSVTGCEYSSKNVTDLSGLSARCFTDGKEVISSLSYSEVHTTTWILQRSKLHKPRRHIRVVFTRIVTKLIFNSVHQ